MRGNTGHPDGREGQDNGQGGPGPNVGDYVIVKIKHIIPYGAFCELVEYPGWEGFIHISEVATSWVKNIRQFVKEGQMRVAKVLRVYSHRKSADLSLKRVSGALEKRKLEEVRRRKRGENLLKLAAQIAGEDPKNVEELLVLEFGDVLHAFEEAAIYGEDAFEGEKIPKKWREAIITIAKKYIEVPKRRVRGEVEILVPGPYGARTIREVMKKAKAKVAGHEHQDVRMFVVGAPKYAVEVTSYDYQSAEKLLREICEFIVEEIKKMGGEASWERVEV